MWRVLGNILYDLDLRASVKVKSSTFEKNLVNVSTPKQLNLTSSNFEGASHDVDGTGQRFKNKVV